MAVGRRSAVLGPLDRLFRAGTAGALSDGQLLERFTTRHDEAAEAAFAALVERHGAMVLHVCRRLLDDPHDAQDAFQATFLVLVRKAGAVRRRDSLASWLYGVARRVSAHARAAAARRRAVELAAIPKPVNVVERGDVERDVLDEVDRLPEVLRAAVVLIYLEGLTHEQAAARLGWPVGTVRSRLARARDRLRSRLTRRGLAPGAALLPALAVKATALPRSILDPTVKAAMLIAVRDAAEAGLVSASAATLTEGVLHTMFVSKLKSAAMALMAAGAVATGTGVFAFQPPSPRPVPEPAPAADIAPDAPRAETAPEVAPDDAHADLLSKYASQIETLVRTAREQQEKGSVRAAERTTRRLETLAREWSWLLSHPHAGEPPAFSPSADLRPDRPFGDAPVLPEPPRLPRSTGPFPPGPRAPRASTRGGGLPSADTAHEGVALPPAAPGPPPPAGPFPPSGPPTAAAPAAPRAPLAPLAAPAASPPTMALPAQPGSPTPPPGSSRDHRLDELERKVDLILRALEKREQDRPHDQ